MRILCNILVVLFVTATAVGQQINPVPDYIFRNSMSVGRNAPTDTSAYFSIGPRFGATRGFMPPMVVDTASVTGTKRNGLLIYSIQRNSFLYWDSTGSRWSRIAANLDTLQLSTRAWRQKGDDSLAAIINTRTDTVNLLSTKAFRRKGDDSLGAIINTRTDTVNLLSTKAWRQKGIDSINAVNASGTGISGYMTRWSGTKTMDTSLIFQQANRIGIGKTAPLKTLDVGGQLGVGMATNADNRGYDIEFSTNQQTGGIDFTTSSPNAFLDLYIGGSLANSGGWSGIMRFFTGATNAYGTERMRINEVGNVGIGNVTPTAGAGYTSVAINNTTGGWLQFFTNGTRSAEIYNNTTAFYVNSLASLPLILQTGGTDGVRLTTSQETLFGTSTDAGDYRVQIAGALYNTTGAVLGANSGSVGIRSVPKAWSNGTPALQLNNAGIYGNNVGDLFLSANSYVDASNVNRYMSNDIAAAFGLLSGNFNFYTTTSGTADSAVTFTESMRFTSGGNLGIGTTSPDAIFHVAKSNSGGIGGQLVIDNPATSALGNTAEISFLTDAGASGTGVRNARILAVNENALTGNANMQFHTWNGSASAERMRISSAGNVGINESSPSERLHVNGRARIITIDSSASPINMLWADVNGVVRKAPVPTASVSGGTTDFIPLWSSSTALTSSIIKQVSSEILIGYTTDQGTFKLQVDGNGFFNGTIKTASPSGDPAAPWKLGKKQAGSVSLDTGNYVEVEIDGTYYRLAIVTAN
jgi:hypothetical protein